MSGSERPVLNDRYEIQQRIGRGGMADVFAARDLLLDRPVAIKVLFPEFAADPNFVERFKREAQAAANLNHPNIVSVYDWGRAGSTYFMAMEYIAGRTLADAIRSNGRISAEAATDIALEVASALGFAHENGVVHRDIKPGNILIAHDGRVKVADFGIARALNSANEQDLTQAGAVMGTATYFSPEQAQGGQPDPRSDLYSLGIVLYEMVAGRPPFSGDNPVGIAYRQVHEAPQPLNQIVPDVPRPFEAIVAKLLAKNPAVRYPTAATLRDDLRRFREGQPVEALTSLLGGTPARGMPVPGTGPGGASTMSLPQTQVSGGYAPGTVAMPRTGADTPGSGMGRPQPVSYAESSTRTAWTVLVAFLVVAALVAGGIVLFQVFTRDESTVTTVTLPRLIDLTIEEATNTLTDLGLAIDPVAQVNEAVAENVVWDQTPAPDTPVRKGDRITVVYNPPSDDVVLPTNLVGLTQEEVIQELAKLGLQYTITPQEDEERAEGLVIATNPPPGSPVAPGGTVELVVSTGKGQEIVPDVTGLPEQDAIDTLELLGFQVDVTRQNDPLVAAGQVISTDPPADQAADKGASISVVVSLGPEPVTVPAVEQLTEAQARAQLQDANLRVRVDYVDVLPGDPRDGRVITQSIDAGQQVNPSTEVKLTVGRATAPPTTPPVPTTAPPTTPPPTTPAPTTAPPTTPAPTTAAPTTTGG
jgi:serine/threonine-protein kinase